MSITLLECEMSAMVWWFEHTLALPFLETEIKTDLFSPVAIAKFFKFLGILSAAFSQHHLPGFEIAQLEFFSLRTYQNPNLMCEASLSVRCSYLARGTMV